MQSPPSVPAIAPPDQIGQLLKLAQRVSQLTPQSATIGAGMLASLVADARRALGQGAAR